MADQIVIGGSRIWPETKLLSRYSIAVSQLVAIDQFFVHALHADHAAVGLVTA